jgi:hypothetical protein
VFKPERIDHCLATTQPPTVVGRPIQESTT